jgi:hypothetical protein
MRTFTRSFHIFNLLVIALIAPNISGCAAPLAALIAPGYFAINHLPSDAKVELTNAVGALAPLDGVNSVLTNNEYAEKFFQDEPGIFSRVSLVKDAPVTMAAASKMAATSGYDAFVFVDTNGPTRAGNLLINKVSYGTVAVTIVSNKGIVLYKQTARLISGATTRLDLNDRQLAEILARAIIDDIKANKGGPVQTSAGVNSEETNPVKKTLGGLKNLLH